MVRPIICRAPVGQASTQAPHNWHCSWLGGEGAFPAQETPKGMRAALPEPAQRLSTTRSRSGDIPSGLWHQAQQSGQPFRKRSCGCPARRESSTAAVENESGLINPGIAR